jgi:L-asparaginase
MAERKTRVAVIGTGGTISSIGRDSLDLVEYGDKGHKAEVADVLELFPEAQQGYDIVPVPYRAVSSTLLQPGDWLALNEKIHEIVDQDPSIAGVVITHGTASLEETAYFLHLVLKVDVPVVLVASQRPPTGLSTDAGLNFLNAVRVAASPAARGLGVLAVLNDEIQSAREVTKTSTYRLDTFRTPDFGILGQADPDGTVAFYRRPIRRHAPDTEFDVRRTTALPTVDIVYTYVGADGRIIDALIESGTEGIVNAGFPAGKPTPAQQDSLIEAVRRGIVVVQSHRGGRGRVIARDKTQEMGFVVADNLNPQKARILAMLALTVTKSGDEIQRIFSEY